MRNTRRTAAPAAIALALLGGHSPAQTVPGTPAAEPAPRYNVEFILFRYADSVSSGNEVFVPDPLTDTELREIVLPVNRVKLTVTPREELALRDIYDKLERLDAYQPVLWSGWTQPIMERERIPVIPLRRLGNAPPEFDGTLQLYLSRYLHLVVDLRMTPRQPNTGAQPGGGVRRFGDRRAPFGPARAEPAPTDRVQYRIRENRIVRNGDLRYFDHPKFGLLARITRVKSAEEPDADALPETATDDDPASPADP